MKVSDIIKRASGQAEFSHYRQGYLYYTVYIKDYSADITAFGVRETRYVFPIELADLGTATLNIREKPITLMRYIRKAIEGDMFVKA